MKKNYLLLILAVLANSISAFSQIVYVTVNGAGLQDGSSWANAYNGQQLASVVSSWPNSPTQVWVAAGTYYADPVHRDSSFMVTTYIKVYGGFAGNETMLSQRNWNTNVTTLSGDIGVQNDITDNTFSIVRFENVSECGIDGFTVTGGNANDVVNPWKAFGGGAFNMSAGTSFSMSKPEIRNCKFINNTTTESGGAIANVGLTGTATLTVEDCYFENNTAIENGGAIYSIGWPTSILQSPPGNSDAIIRNSTFVGNTVTGNNTAGGAIAILNGGGANDAHIVSCHFEDNYSPSTGGAICNTNYSGIVLNTGTYNILIDSSSFVHNGTESTSGMAITNLCIYANTGDMTVKNSLFEDNYTMLPVGFASSAIWLAHTGSYVTRNRFIGCRFINNSRAKDGDVIISASNPNMDGTVTGDDSLWISNCFFYNNFRGEDISVSAHDDTRHVTIISNSTIYHDTTTAGYINSVYSATQWYMGTFPLTRSSVYIYNSILYHAVPTWLGGFPMEIRTENFFGAPASSTYTFSKNSVITECLPWPAEYGVNGGGNNDDYPGFVDTPGMDFHLVCNAFGVDHGDNAMIFPDNLATDVDGDGRIFNGTVDIGAFETHIMDLILIPAVTISGMNIDFTHNMSGFTDSVHWDFGDGHTSIVDNGTHTYTQPGTYTICLYAENSCGTDDTCFDITLTTAVAGLSKEEDQIIPYPNPVSDVLHVDDMKDAGDVLIYNNVGQLLFKMPAKEEKTLHINISGLPPGLYLLEIRQKDGKTLHGRFVKQ